MYFLLNIILFTLMPKLYTVAFVHDFDYPLNENKTRACDNNNSLSYPIIFQEYDVIPQVIFNVWQLNMTKDENEVQASVSKIEKGSFFVNIACPKSGSVEAFKFKWSAINDQRIQIINCYNMTQIKKSTFIHDNPNAQLGYVSITSIGFKGGVKFYLNITQLNITAVTVDIIGNYENVTQLGYQIILGVNGSFKKLNDSFNSDNFTSQNYNVESNSILANCFYGFDFSNSENFNFISSIDRNQTNNSFSYIIQPIGGGSHNSVFLIAEQIQTTYLPLQFQKLQITQFEDFAPQTESLIIILNQEEKDEFSTIGVFLKIIDKQFDKIQISTRIKCETNQTIKSTFNKFKNSVLQKSFNLIHRCDENIKQIKFDLDLTNADKSFNELIVNISKMRYTVSQIIYNQVKEEYILYEIYRQQ
ncbi:unnamed protein product (macronuclear) [Paramecium tetraurelia]|uniref:H-type lectin domain-containing protein n=1 Tax=Paramecium tetraurelia TaxID=5888 RepID=A0E321_PARTE|nr:uncharacterized protein GSPATT00022861001 [Paramecium tetraurelia]CAK89688.1 unnamed protein product [Paramecium tetraurelia]|eukprot:XP_001457085.1 hypothetical protein (macronuclear) [Paramecium tetraurelia strain d4-2]